MLLQACTSVQAGDDACKADTAKAWQACGDDAREKGDNRSALAAYSEALRLDPRLFAAYSGRALTYFHTGNLQAPIDELNACIRVEATYANAYYYLAFYLIKAGRLEEALAAYTNAIRFYTEAAADPPSERVRGWFSNDPSFASHPMQGSSLRSIDFYLADAYYWRAEVNHRLGNAEDATVDLAKAHQIDVDIDWRNKGIAEKL